MKGFTLCFVYLLIAVYSVNSASFYYRNAREVVVPPVIDEIIDEARKQNPGLRLEALEVVPAVAQPVENVATVADTVKSAAVEAIRTQNEEVLVTEVKTDAIVPVVNPVVPVVPEELKSNVVVDEVKIVDSVPVVETVELKTIAEAPAPVIEPVVIVKETPVADVLPVEELPKEKSAPVVQEVVVVEKINDIVPEIRQTNPIEQIQTSLQNTIQNIQNSLQSTFGNIPIVSQLVPRPPQSDATGEGAAIASSVAPASPAIEAVQDAAATPALEVTSAAPPNLLQNAINSITSFLQRSTTTLAPATETPIIVSGTRGGEETVEVVQHIDVDDKVDVAKKV